MKNVYLKSKYDEHSNPRHQILCLLNCVIYYLIPAFLLVEFNNCVAQDKICTYSQFLIETKLLQETGTISLQLHDPFVSSVDPLCMSLLQFSILDPSLLLLMLLCYNMGI